MRIMGRWVFGGLEYKDKESPPIPPPRAALPPPSKLRVVPRIRYCPTPASLAAASASSATGGPAVFPTSVVARKSRSLAATLVGELIRDLGAVLAPG